MCHKCLSSPCCRSELIDSAWVVIVPGQKCIKKQTNKKQTTASKTAMRGTLDAAMRAFPHLIAHKLASTIAAAAKKRRRVDIDANHSLGPQLKKAFVDTGGIDINAPIDGSGIVLD